MEHGSNEGYILLVDYSGYYANIPHDKCIEVLDYFLEREVEDPETLLISEMLTRLILKTFEQDVSRFSDEEIAAMMAGKVNPMLNCGVDPELLTGEKMLRKARSLPRTSASSTRTGWTTMPRSSEASNTTPATPTTSMRSQTPRSSW